MAEANFRTYNLRSRPVYLYENERLRQQEQELQQLLQQELQIQPEMANQGQNAANPHNWIPFGINPPTFDGSKIESASKWLRKFERYAQASGAAGNDRCNVMGLLLTGMAETWFNSLAEGVRTNYQQLEQAFRNQFIEVPASNIQRKIQMVTRQQFLTESVDNYFTDLRSKFEGQNLPVDLEVALLINGLRQDIRSAVLQQGPYETVPALLDKFRRVEASLPSGQAQLFAINPLMTAASYEAESSELKELREEMREMRIALKKLTDKMSRSRETTPTRRVSFADLPIACYICGRQGHIARECRANGTRYRNESPGRQSPRRSFKPQSFMNSRRSPSPRYSSRDGPTRNFRSQNFKSQQEN